MGGTGPGAVGERPAWRRWALAVAPWLAAAVLAAMGWSSRQPAPATAAPATAAASVVPSPVPSPTPSPSVEDTDGRLAPTVELAVVAAARTALGTAGLPTGGPAPERWPLEARVVDVTGVTEDLAVATVHGLVIERTDDGWGDPVLRAVAVPLRTEPAPSVLGAGWALPAPPAPGASVSATPVVDPDPSLTAPLEDAGWTVTGVDAVDLVDGHLLRVVLDGTAPDASRPARHTVWLLDTPGGTQLLAPPITAHEDPS